MHDPDIPCDHKQADAEMSDGGKKVYQEDEQMKTENKKELVVIRMCLVLAGIAFIILSMVKDQTTTHYLMIGLLLTAAANIINCRCLFNKKGSNDGSGKNRSIS